MPRGSPQSNDPRDIAEWVVSAFDEFKEELVERMDKKLEEQSKLYLSGYVDSDPHAHRAWHKKESESAAYQKEIVRDIIKKAVIGTLGTLAYLNWEAISHWLKAMGKAAG